MIVAQDRPDVTIFRRANKWSPESFGAEAESVMFKSLDIALPFASVYDGVLKLDSH
jgi:hypothetical protein